MKIRRRRIHAYRYLKTADWTKSGILVRRPFLGKFRTDDNNFMRRLWETQTFIGRGLHLSLQSTFKYVHHEIFKQKNVNINIITETVLVKCLA